MTNPTQTLHHPGRTYLSGNTYYPTCDVYVARAGFAALPASEKRAHRILGSQHGYAPEATEYVVYVSRGRRCATPVRVWEATRFETLGDMIAAYAARRAS